MSLRDEIKTRSAGLVRRERLTLPECGAEVQVRGLMKGEVERAGNHKRSSDVQIALSVEDPATGQALWNPNKHDDLEEIAALHSVDAAVILQASNRLSGMDKLGKMFSPAPDSSSSPSPSDSGEPSGS